MHTNALTFRSLDWYGHKIFWCSVTILLSCGWATPSCFPGRCCCLGCGLMMMSQLEERFWINRLLKHSQHFHVTYIWSVGLFEYLGLSLNCCIYLRLQKFVSKKSLGIVLNVVKDSPCYGDVSAWIIVGRIVGRLPLGRILPVSLDIAFFSFNRLLASLGGFFLFSILIFHFITIILQFISICSNIYLKTTSGHTAVFSC